MTRSDEHRPSAIVPEDYEYVAMKSIKIEMLGDTFFMQHEREVMRLHRERTKGEYSSHEHGGSCMVCGSVNAVYLAIFYHQKSNKYVLMGTDCARKCEMGDENIFRTFRKNVQDALARHAGKAKAKAVLAEKGLSKAWEIYESDSSEKEERIVKDIVGKLVNYGSISDRQSDFIGKLLGQIENRAKVRAEREAERASALPCPTGRIAVIGTVVSIKEIEIDDDRFSFSRSPVTIWKMLVKSEHGWLVWGSVPSALSVEKGDKVTFRATITPSNDDPKFGFFKRPSNASKLA